ncbi:hypothetical protein [Microcystis phage Mel-JY01]
MSTTQFVTVQSFMNDAPFAKFIDRQQVFDLYAIFVNDINSWFWENRRKSRTDVSAYEFERHGYDEYKKSVYAPSMKKRIKYIKDKCRIMFIKIDEPISQRSEYVHVTVNGCDIETGKLEFELKMLCPIETLKLIGIYNG